MPRISYSFFLHILLKLFPHLLSKSSSPSSPSPPSRPPSPFHSPPHFPVFFSHRLTLFIHLLLHLLHRFLLSLLPLSHFPNSFSPPLLQHSWASHWAADTPVSPIPGGPAWLILWLCTSSIWDQVGVLWGCCAWHRCCCGAGKQLWGREYQSPAPSPTWVSLLLWFFHETCDFG